MIPDKEILSGVPQPFRDALFRSYKEITLNFLERRWEPSELNGGKFCEATYGILEGELTGAFGTQPSKPSNMADACRALERIPSLSSRVGDRSLRILIPRILVSLYEIRNNRGVGHVGGDVMPNYLDSSAVLAMASWVMAELIRIFHSVSTEEAQIIVDNLVERRHPLVWKIEETRRILDPSLKARPQTLLLLYHSAAWVADRDLFRWVEYSNFSVFRVSVLGSLHSDRLIEYDSNGGRAHISPLGVTEVESNILKTK